MILCRSCSESQSDQITDADNHMMVKSSIICQGLVHHYRSVREENENDGADPFDENLENDHGDPFAAETTPKGSPPPPSPTPTAASNTSNFSSNEQQPSPMRKMSKKKGPRMSISSEAGFVIGNASKSDEDVVKHFDLHVVHQLFSDMVKQFST
jgi:hypothetical protein